MKELQVVILTLILTLLTSMTVRGATATKIFTTIFTAQSQNPVTIFFPWIEISAAPIYKKKLAVSMPTAALTKVEGVFVNVITKPIETGNWPQLPRSLKGGFQQKPHGTGSKYLECSE